MRFNINWPSTPDNSLATWYEIAWRLPFMCLYMAFMFLGSICLFFAYGPVAYQHFWRNVP